MGVKTLSAASWFLLAGICAFPYVGGVVAQNDEVALVYNLNGVTSLSGEDLGRWVWTYKFFRPLDQFLAPWLVDAPSRDALYQQIITADPPDPRTLNPHIPGDLKVVIETASRGRFSGRSSVKKRPPVRVTSPPSACTSA